MNVLREGDTGPFGLKINGSIGIYETLVKAEKSRIWKTRRKYKSKSSAPWCKIGVGVSSAVKGFGFGALPDFAAVSIQLTPAGKFVVGVSCPEIGQGATTAYAQIAAEALNCDIDEVYIASADSQLAPDSGTSSASMALVRGGNAILAAAPKMTELLLKAAGEMLHENPQKLTARQSQVTITKNSKKSVSYSDIAQYLQRMSAEMKIIAGYNVPRAEKPVQGTLEIPHLSYMYSSAVALVEVDTLTGATKVLKFFLSPDCGSIINPQSYTGQCEGAIVQGLGFALTEDTQIVNGVVRTNNFTTYVIPTIADIPEIEIDPVETYERTGPFGAKGLGEIGIIPVGSAVANAIHDATGARIYTLPATPERVYSALKAKVEP
jgi:CO/xanthine dehydrogenase Mo-binding subunit